MKYFRISPCFDYMYHGYYIKGLIDLYGIEKIEFCSDGFPPLSIEGLAFIDLRTDKRFFFDTQDSDEIELYALDWSDLYAKVNLNIEKIPHNNMVSIRSISPGFAIHFSKRISHLLKSVFCCSNFGISKHYYNNCQRIIKSYHHQYFNRLPIESYNYDISTTSDNFIFFASSVWAPEDTCNKYRSLFMNAASDMEGVIFEGGFTPPHRDDEVYSRNYRICKRYKIIDYITLVKKSLVAFNTPAVLDCHGWKFGEYYALGKAIISTPIKRELPKQPKHGENIHFIDGSRASMRKALNTIQNDCEYRKHLERNAMKYFNENLSPKAAVMDIVNEENNINI